MLRRYIGNFRFYYCAQQVLCDSVTSEFFMHATIRAYFLNALQLEINTDSQAKLKFAAADVYDLFACHHLSPVTGLSQIGAS
jgi:hypothetical protein